MSNFPPQVQSQQPGVEYKMHPLPQSLNPNYKPSNKLKGKVALITGGDSGIGRAVSYYYALEGATVAITYVAGIEDKDKDETIQMLKDFKTCEAKDPIAIATDVGCEKSCRKVIEQVVSEYGQIDILVNNAAVQYSNSTMQETTAPLLEKMFKVNVFACFYLSRYALEHMKEGSVIINTASVAAYTGEASLLGYSATKGAVVNFTRSLSQLLLDRKIRVNAVSPGPVWTPLQIAFGSQETPQSFNGVAAAVPMKRAAQPWEMGPSYVFLASNDCSSYYTGQVLHPNGGNIINC